MRMNKLMFFVFTMNLLLCSCSNYLSDTKALEILKYKYEQYMFYRLAEEHHSSTPDIKSTFLEELDRTLQTLKVKRCSNIPTTNDGDVSKLCTFEFDLLDGGAKQITVLFSLGTSNEWEVSKVY